MTNPEFSELIDRYKKTIPEKLGTIQNLINALKQTPSEENLKNLRAFVHKTVGNTGGYGYLEASDACRQFEQFLLDKLAKPFDDFSWIDQCDAYYRNIIKGFNEQRS